MTRLLSKLVFLMAACELLYSCAVTYTDMTGHMPRAHQVVDAESGAPVPNSIVVVYWNRTVTVIESNTSCDRALALMTDSNGRYELPLWAGRLPSIASVYKKGYSDATEWPAKGKGIDEVKRFTGTPMQRLQDLNRFGPRGCEDDEKKMAILWVPIAEEANELAKTPEEKLKASDFQYLADKSLHGIDEARRMQVEREATIRNSMRKAR